MHKKKFRARNLSKLSKEKIWEYVNVAFRTKIKSTEDE